MHRPSIGMMGGSRLPDASTARSPGTARPAARDDGLLSFDGHCEIRFRQSCPSHRYGALTEILDPMTSAARLSSLISNAVTATTLPTSVGVVTPPTSQLPG